MIETVAGYALLFLFVGVPALFVYAATVSEWLWQRGAEGRRLARRVRRALAADEADRTRDLLRLQGGEGDQ